MTRVLPLLLTGLGCTSPQHAKIGTDSGPASGLPPPSDCPAVPVLSDEVGSADWTPAQPMPAGDIEQLRRFSGDGELIWAASAQNGLWHSEDGGRHWTESRGTPRSHNYGQMALHGTDPDTLVYSSDQGWISRDGGEHFAPFGLDWTHVESSVRGLVFVGDQLFAAQLDGQVQRSDDFGASWEAVGRVPPPLSSAPPSAGHDEKADLWLGVTDSGAILATSTGYGLYRSTDGGETFDTALSDHVLGGVFAVSGDHAVVGASRDDQTLLYTSTDGGESWAEHTTVDGILRGIWIDDNGDLMGTVADGLWIEGTGLVSLSGPGWGSFDAVVRTEAGDILVGHRLGIAGSADGGASFASWSTDMVDRDLINVTVHPQCPGVVFSGTQCRSGLYRSMDHGQTFARPDNADMHYVMTTVVSPSAPQQIWNASDDVLWKSSDFGETWTSINPLGTGPRGVHFHGLAVHPTEPERVLAGSVGSGDYADEQAKLYASDDGGQTWAVTGDGLPDTEESFHALHFVVDDPDIVLLGTFPAGEGVTHAGGTGVGMFRSTDGAETWTEVDVNTSDVQIFAECGGQIYAATGAGVLRSGDQGVSWDVVLPAGEGTKAVACHDNTVVAIDPGWGVQRSDDGGEHWTDWTGTLRVELSEIHNQLGLQVDGHSGRVIVALPGQGLAMRSLVP